MLKRFMYRKVVRMSPEKMALAYDRHADALYRLALAQLQSREDAEDAVQDAFAKYLTSAPDLADAEQERAWLVRVTVNLCRDLLRKRKHRGYVPLEELAETLHGPDGMPEPHGDGLMEKLGRIPEKHRAAIVLHHLEGYGVEQTARLLGISVPAVKMRLSRGRDALRELLEKEG